MLIERHSLSFYHLLSFSYHTTLHCTMLHLKVYCIVNVVGPHGKIYIYNFLSLLLILKNGLQLKGAYSRRNHPWVVPWELLRNYNEIKCHAKVVQHKHICHR